MHKNSSSSHRYVDDAFPGRIITGPDRNLWFTEDRGIERLGQFRLFRVPSAGGAFGDNTPGSLVADGQGVIWFTAGPNIGRLGTDGMWFGIIGHGIGEMTPIGGLRFYRLPRSVVAVISLAQGTDGAMWFSTVGLGVGHVNPKGIVTYTVVSKNRLDAYQGITRGADGSIWFTMGCQNSIGHITSGGKLTVTHIPSAIPDGGTQCPGFP